MFTPAIQGCRHWTNTELLKDKGLTGYCLAAELGARAVMPFGTKPEDYPYAAALPGLEIVYAESTGASAYLKALKKRFAEMDVLILHGMYQDSAAYLNMYRVYRPDGKVYCGLDMNRHWLRRIDKPTAGEWHAAERCDVVATSCRAMRDAVNRSPHVRFSCRWLPNGFYNPAGLAVAADAARKENVILTVGRIGTEQKNNLELLHGFARAGARLDGWTLRLVGSVEPDFLPAVERFFEDFPALRARVTLAGSVTDKAALFAEYARAKIFALTSKLEGGTPNVYAEALFHGCLFVTSDIDAASDITNFGELGFAYALGDTDALADALVRAAERTDPRGLRAHIPKALTYAARHFDWNRNARKLARMLYAAPSPPPDGSEPV